jgi:hypothetical protein
MMSLILTLPLLVTVTGQEILPAAEVKEAVRLGVRGRAENAVLYQPPQCMPDVATDGQAVIHQPKQHAA